MTKSFIIAGLDIQTIAKNPNARTSIKDPASIVKIIRWMRLWNKPEMTVGGTFYKRHYKELTDSLGLRMYLFDSEWEKKWKEIISRSITKCKADILKSGGLVANDKRESPRWASWTDEWANEGWKGDLRFPLKSLDSKVLLPHPNSRVSVPYIRTSCQRFKY